MNLAEKTRHEGVFRSKHQQQLSPHLEGYPAERLAVSGNVKVNRRVFVRSRGAAAVHARGGERQRAQLYPV